MADSWWVPSGKREQFANWKMAHRQFGDLPINSMVIFQLAMLHNQRVNWVIVPSCPHYVLNYFKNHCWWISIPWSSHETSIWSSRFCGTNLPVVPFYGRYPAVDPGGPWQGSEDFLSWWCLLEAQEMCGLWLEIVCVCNYIYMCMYIYICIYIYV